MRIAFVTDTFYPEVNGVTTVLRRMVKTLSAVGHDVRVVAPQYPIEVRYPPSELRIPSVSFPPYPAIRLARPAIRRVSRFLDEFSPDIIHVVTEGPLGWVGRRYALQHDVALVTSYHSNFPIACHDYGVPWLEPVVWKWIEWFHRPALITQTPGESARDSLRQHGVDHAVIWGRGVDIGFFNPDRRSNAWRSKHNIAPSDVIVTHVGRLAREKNVSVLLDAFNLLRGASFTSMQFIIAGAGPMEREAVDRVPFARHLGFLGRDDLADLYANSDLCVLPSPWETCGLVALEAMASGVPVIAADARGFRESVEQGVTGFLVSPKDARGFASAVSRLATNRATRQEMGHAARVFAETRDARREDQQLIAQYQSVIPTQKGVALCSVAW